MKNKNDQTINYLEELDKLMLSLDDQQRQCIIDHIRNFKWVEYDGVRLVNPNYPHDENEPYTIFKGYEVIAVVNQN